MSAGRLDLDFATARRRVDPLGAGLLAAGLALAAISAWAVADALASEAASTRQLAELSALADRARVPPKPGAALDPRQAARLQAGRQMAQALDSPWADLLDALENRPSSDVALLSVEPSAIKRTVSITAEARTAQAMLDHLELLQRDRRLARVTLVSHQRQVQLPGTPWRYQIQGSW